MASKKRPIAERIKAALAKGYVCLSDLERAVFPPKDWPNAWRVAVQGGPPACRRVLVAALKRYEVPIWVKHPNADSLVGPWPGTTIPVAVVKP